MNILFQQQSFLVDALDDMISPQKEGYLHWLLTTLQPNASHSQHSDFPMTHDELEPHFFQVHLANLAWKPKHDVRLPAGKSRVLELLPEIKTDAHDGKWVFKTSPLRLRAPSGPAHELDPFELEADKGCLRLALMHLIAFVAYENKLAMFEESTLAKSMNCIECLSIHATSEQDRFLQIQRFQHKESLRTKTSVAGWIFALSNMSDPHQFMMTWNADCNKRGCPGNGFTGAKEQAVKLWIQHHAQMKKVMAYVVSVGYPGNLPEKFYHENLLPGKKWTAQNSTWGRSGRCKVTSASWDLMWERCLAILAASQGPIDFDKCERAARQAALLTASSKEVTSTDGTEALLNLIADWKEGSPTLNSQLDTVITVQAENWQITHLIAFSELLNEIEDAKANRESLAQYGTSDHRSALDKLELQRKELDGQVVEALEATYEKEMAKIKHHVMSETCVQKATKRKQELLQTERYEESCKAAKLFYETNIHVIECGEKEKKTKLLLRVQDVLRKSVSSPTDTPRYLVLANFRVPAAISTRDYDLSISMTSALLQHGKENAAAVILAPDHPATGRRQADLSLVQTLHEHAVWVSNFHSFLI